MHILFINSLQTRFLWEYLYGNGVQDKHMNIYKFLLLDDYESRFLAQVGNSLSEIGGSVVFPLLYC